MEHYFLAWACLFHQVVPINVIFVAEPDQGACNMKLIVRNEATIEFLSFLLISERRRHGRGVFVACIPQALKHLLKDGNRLHCVSFYRLLSVVAQGHLAILRSLAVPLQGLNRIWSRKI